MNDALTARRAHDTALREITASEDAHAALLLAPGALPAAVGLLTAARVRAWDEFEKAYDTWVKKWAAAAKWEAPAWAAEGRRKAARVPAHLDYAIQTRHKMRVIDDERQFDFQSRDR